MPEHSRRKGDHLPMQPSTAIPGRGLIRRKTLASKRAKGDLLDATRASRRLPGAARRAQLLEIARGIILRSGISALTMEALAEIAGVTKPIVYRHFGNSEDVTVAVLTQYASRSIEFTMARVEGARDLEEFFDRVIDGLFDFIHQNGALSRSITTGFSSTARIDACFQDMQNRALRIYDHLLLEQGVTESRAQIASYALKEMINSTILEFAHRDEPGDRAALKEMVRGTVRALVGTQSKQPHVPARLLVVDEQG